MRFTHPEFALGFLLVVGLGYVLWRSDSRRVVGLKRWFGSAIHPEAVRVKRYAFLAALSFGIVAAMAPQERTLTNLPAAGGHLVYIALDVSGSMRTQDASPSRLVAAQTIASQLADALPGDPVGLLVFAGQAYTQCPLTTDRLAFRTLLERTATEQFVNQSTNLRAVLRLAALRFYEAQQPLARKSLVILTDGEDFGSAFQSALNNLEALGVRAFVVGIGTRGGGPIPTDSSGTGYLRAPNGEVARSALSVPALKEIAKRLKAPLYLAQSDTAKLTELSRTLAQQASSGAIAPLQEERWVDRYHWPLALGLASLIVSLVIGSAVRLPAINQRE